MSGNYPYWTPGWTAQNPVYGSDWQDSLGTPSYATATLPDDLSLVTVSAKYVDLLGRFYDSMVTFTVVDQTNDVDGATILLPTVFRTWLTNGLLSVQLIAGFTYYVVEGMPGGRKYYIYIDPSSPDTANLVDLVVIPGQRTFNVGSDQWLINEASGDLDALFVGTLTRNTDGAVTVANVEWPNGVTGTYTSLVFSTSFPGYVDSFQITYVTGAVTKTVTQPTMTRDAGGSVIARPEMVVS